MSDIIFHIGYPKTGTTYLQKRILSQTEGLGNHSSVAGAAAIDREMRNCVRCYPPTVWRSAYGRELAHRILQTGRRRPIIYSSEYFLHPVFFHLKVDQVRPTRWGFAAVEHLEAFQADAWQGRVRAIVTVRNQAEWLASLYAQRSRAFKASQRDFENRVREILNRPGPDGLAFLDYARLVRELRMVLGPENVAVLFYEDLGQPMFWEEFRDFTGFAIDPGAGQGRDNVRREASAWRLRPRRISVNKGPGFNKFTNGRNLLKHVVNPVWKRVSAQRNRKIQLSDALRRDILASYRDSNLALQELVGKRLDERGYFSD